MDSKTPEGEAPAETLKSERIALNVLALCFVLALLGRGLSESFGWDRAQVVSVYSLTWLAGGLTAPVIGRLFDRYGPRTVYSLGLLLIGGAFLLASWAQTLWQLQLSIGIGPTPLLRLHASACSQKDAAMSAGPGSAINP